MDTWTITTTATPTQARTTTGVTEWEPSPTGSTWTGIPRGIATSVVHALRADGYNATTTKDLPDTIASTLHSLRALGDHRRARSAADRALKTAKTAFDEEAAWAELRDNGVPVAQIAREAGCDRKMVHAVLAARRA